MNVFRSVAAGILACATAFAQTAPELTPQKEAPPSRVNFSLIPKAFRKNPDLDITVISELSDAGKTRPIASVENPIYYVLHPGGYHPRGEPMSQKPMPSADVERVLRKALASSGYLPATAEHAPSLVIIYIWGSHNMLGPESAISGEQVLRNVLDRAALVGGEKFAGKLGKAFDEASMVNEASARPLGSGAEDPAMGGDARSMDLGAAAALQQMNGLTDPVKRFAESSSKNNFLVNQAGANCYYIVASAFDYESLVSPRKQLLWRTRMTVSSDGVSQLEAIPVMITASAPYFGKEMTESEIITKPAVQKGRVEVGTPTLAEPAPSKPAEKK
ncbi:MAG TPA: hypothetical protein VHO24_08250 [Opitutaceae bacterium]|nr:hypothetical protein [Opitutaceae bacterium]